MLPDHFMRACANLIPNLKTKRTKKLCWVGDGPIREGLKKSKVLLSPVVVLLRIFTAW